jgi:hypothetical protein
MKTAGPPRRVEGYSIDAVNDYVKIVAVLLELLKPGVT